MDNDFDFINLQLNIDTLISSRTKLILENKVLRQKLASMIQKHAILENKNQTVIKKLKSLITQIKEKVTHYE